MPLDVSSLPAAASMRIGALAISHFWLALLRLACSNRAARTAGGVNGSHDVLKSFVQPNLWLERAFGLRERIVYLKKPS